VHWQSEDGFRREPGGEYVSDSLGPNSGERTDEIAAEVRIDLSPANRPGHKQAVGGIEETSCETTTCLINTRSI